MISVFKKIFKEDGPRGLYRGLAPNFMKVVPAVSISYVVYEHLRMSLGCLLYTSPSPRDLSTSRMPSSA